MKAGDTVGGRYEVLRRIGAGGMATVYMAHDPLLDRDVAIKVPRLESSANGDSPGEDAENAEVRERFQAELRAIGRLNHPNIVTIYDGGHEGGSPYLVMEPVDGESLAELIRREAPLPVDRAVDIARQVAEALAYAHDLRLVHRDIKPHNILLDRTGRAKVTDFGIAKSADVTRTLTGTVWGTASFIAPEVSAGEPATASADIYGLGVVLYQMLTGHTPFEAENPIAAAVRSQREDPKPPSDLADVPEWLDAVVLQALAREPEQRYESARDLADDLARGVKGQGSGLSEGKTERVRVPQAEVRLKAYQRSSPKATAAKPAHAGSRGFRRRRIGVAVALPLAVTALVIGGVVFAISHVPSSGSGTPSPKVPVPSGRPNLLTNGALLPNGSGPPSGWRMQTFQGAGPRWSYQPGGPGGVQDHEVTLSSSSGTDTAWIGNNVNVQPGWPLTLSGYIKTDGVPSDGSGTMLQLVCQGSDGKNSGQASSSPIRGNTGWTEVQAQLTAPANTTTCFPLLRLGDQGKPTSGTAEFSRISLVAATSSSSSAVAAVSVPAVAGEVTARKPQVEKKDKG